MLHAQRAHEVERLAAGARRRRARASPRPRRLRRSAVEAAVTPPTGRPPREVHDRAHARLLDVQHAPALAARARARGRAGSRSAACAPAPRSQGGAASPRAPERATARASGPRARRARSRPCLDRHGEQHQAAVAIGIREPARGRTPSRRPTARTAGSTRRRPPRPAGARTPTSPRSRARERRQRALISASSGPSHAIAQSPSDPGNGSRRPTSSGGDPRVRDGRRPELVLGELDEAPDERVVQRGDAR